MQKRETERLCGCDQYMKNRINYAQYIPIHNKAQKYIGILFVRTLLYLIIRAGRISILIKHLIKMLLSIRRKTQQCCLPKNRLKTQNSEVAKFRDIFFFFIKAPLNYDLFLSKSLMRQTNAQIKSNRGLHWAICPPSK